TGGAARGRAGGGAQAAGGPLGRGVGKPPLAAGGRPFARGVEARVATATRHLEELDRAKSAFVAVASHELRTPLTALRGFSEILAARSLAPDEVRRMAGIMGAEAARLGRIVSDLLDLSRLERGLEPTLHRVPVAVEAA